MEWLLTVLATSLSDLQELMNVVNVYVLHIKKNKMDGYWEGTE